LSYECLLNMKKLVIIGCFIIVAICPNLTFSQTNSWKPIKISELEKGLNDFDYLRAILLENGFKFSRHDSAKGNIMETEYWEVPDIDKSNTYGIQFHLIQVMFGIGINGNPEIYISIQKNKIPNYTSDFIESIKKTFPEKKVSGGTHIINGNKVTSYYLTYYKLGGKIFIDVNDGDDSEVWINIWE